jgi:uncharacterized Ntn-hydrolase superfamily protein
VTFSIAARCDRTGMLGAAVSTAFPAVGALAPWAAPRAGVVCTQAGLNVYLGIDGVALLRDGLSAETALAQVLGADPEPEQRQLGIVDGRGRSAAHTGAACVPAATHACGQSFTAQGNMLATVNVVSAMAASFTASDGDLAERLVLAIEAAQSAGGDKRGTQSAALLIYDREEWPYLSLRVDDHPKPILELRRVLEVARRQLPFVRTLPTRANPRGITDEDVKRMNLAAPDDR